MPVMPAAASERKQQEANTFQALRAGAVCATVHHSLWGSDVKHILLRLGQGESLEGVQK